MPRCIEIAPTKTSDSASTIRAAITSSDALPIPGTRLEDGNMGMELAHLRRIKGWKKPEGLFGYTKDAEYKDIFAYFDHGDKRSPVNELATKALSMYGLGGAQIFAPPTWGPIRGSVVIVRLQPDYGFSPDAVYRPDIPLEEIYDTLVFFRDAKMSARDIATKRDSVRMMKSMGMPGVRPGFGSVPAGVNPEDPSNYSHYFGPSGGLRKKSQVNKDQDKCDHCGREQSLLGQKLKMCVRCKKTFYCGKECQKAAWKKHKKVCTTL